MIYAAYMIAALIASTIIAGGLGRVADAIVRLAHAVERLGDLYNVDERRREK